MRILSDESVKKLIDLQEVIDAVGDSFELETVGETKVPPRQTIDYSSGWFRIMPAVVVGRDSAVMGAKIMNLVAQHNGDKVQYLILLYDPRSGELLSAMDGAVITQMRTAGATAAVATRIVGDEPVQLTIIGSGFVAQGQLRALFHKIKFRRILVYSPRAENRNSFAELMGKELGVNIQPCESLSRALSESHLVLLATRSKVAVVDGDALAKNAVVLSIGSTRRDFREMDLRTMARARCVLVDHVDQVLAESGDIQAGLESHVLEKHHLYPVSKFWADGLIPKYDNRDLVVFKSSGTAMQDLVVAYRVYRKAVEQDVGSLIHEFPAFRTLR